MSALTLDFIDINGNPIPAGVRVDIYAGSTVSGTAVISAYLGYGASVNAQQTLTDGSTYTCSFFGTQAPTTTVTFTASAAPATQTLTCHNYISPDPNQAGYAALQTSLWPRGWFSDSAMTSGGVAYNLAYALGWANALIDQQTQETTAAARLQSSVSNAIDSWAYDFFGNNLPRNPGESDAAYIGRIEAMLAAKQSTPAGVKAVAGFFGTAWVDEPWRTAETGAWDTNGVFAWDSVGGWGTQDAGIAVYAEAPAGTDTAAMKSTIMASRPVGMMANVYQVLDTTKPLYLSEWIQNVGPNREGVVTVPADGTAASVAHVSPFVFSSGSVRFGLSNYTGTDNASLRVRISSGPTLTGFSVIVSGGQSGSKVNLNYRASGDPLAYFALPL